MQNNANQRYNNKNTKIVNLPIVDVVFSNLPSYLSQGPSFHGVSFKTFQLHLFCRSDRRHTAIATVAIGGAEGLVEDVEAALALGPFPRWKWGVSMSQLFSDKLQ